MTKGLDTTPLAEGDDDEAGEMLPPVEPQRSPVTFNATKHGILSVSPVIPWLETEEDWLEFRDGIFESIQPDDFLQSFLADRVADIAWRILRLRRYERESIANSLRKVARDMVLNAGLAHQDIPPPESIERKEEMDRMAMYRLIPGEETLDKIGRYETRLHRQLLQTIRQIAALKKWTGDLPERLRSGPFDGPSPN
jgi:hypothetical protein